MGLCYHYGRGVGRDVAQAMAWFRRAAAQGSLAAAQVVQQSVILGEGTRQVIDRFTNVGLRRPDTKPHTTLWAS
jgi:TPR repeat protein